jgi:urease accessory protein
MLRVESILGSISDPQMAERVHHVSHHGHVEFLEVSGDDLERRRLMKTTGTGLTVAIALPRDQKLFDGAVLHLEKKQAVIVRSGQQRWLRFVPTSAEAALELGYHAGNLHWRVKFDGEALLVAQDGAAQTYTDRIAPLLSSGRVSFTEVAAS